MAVPRRSRPGPRPAGRGRQAGRAGNRFRTRRRVSAWALARRLGPGPLCGRRSGDATGRAIPRHTVARARRTPRRHDHGPYLILTSAPPQVPDLHWEGQASTQTSASPRKRLVKHCTMRFRGNAIDATAGAVTIRVDAPAGGMTDFASVLRGRPAGYWRPVRWRQAWPGRLGVAPMSSVAPRRLTQREQLPPRRQRRWSEVLSTAGSSTIVKE